MAANRRPPGRARPWPSRPRAVGVVLGFRPDGGPVGVLLAVALLLVFSFSLSWVWTGFGLRLPNPESVMQMSMTVLFR